MQAIKIIGENNWEISVTEMAEIETLVRAGMPVRVGSNAVRQVKTAVVEYVYNDQEMQRKYGKRRAGWLVDLGTDGIAGHGYNGEVHWYFCPGNTIYPDCLMFQSPANLREGDWRGDGVEIVSEGNKVICLEWEAPTKCGCIR